MRYFGKISRFFIFLPTFLISIFGWFLPAKAESINGLDVTAYYIGYDIPPDMSDTAYQVCEGADTYYPNINQNWGGGVVANCAYDQVMLHYSGYITIPEHQYVVSFLIYSDDGGWVDIGGNEFGYWGDRGCSSTWSGYLELDAGSYPIDNWFYENGGGACSILYWSIDYGPWEIVPSSAFTTTEPGPPTTTTTTTTTIAPYLNPPQNPSIIYVAENYVSISWEPPVSSNVEIERYAIFFSCDNWDTGYAVASIETSISIYNLNPDTECQFKIRSDNDTLGVYSDFSQIVTGRTSPTTTTTTTTTIPETTTTTTLPETTTTTTIPETTTTSTTTTLPVTTTTVPVTTTTVPETTTTEVTQIEETTTTTVPEPTPDQESEIQAEEILDSIIESGEVTEEVVDEFVDLVETGDLSTEQVQEIIDEILGSEIDQEVVTALVTSPDVIENLTPEQAAEVFNEVIVGQLTDEEAEKVVAAVQEAPKEVREAFEEEINVFGGKFDGYKPVGSQISVGERRVLVAVGAVLSTMPTIAASGSSGGAGGPGGSGPSGGSNNGGSKNRGGK